MAPAIVLTLMIAVFLAMWVLTAAIRALFIRFGVPRTAFINRMLAATPAICIVLFAGLIATMHFANALTPAAAAYEMIFQRKPDASISILNKDVAIGFDYRWVMIEYHASPEMLADDDIRLLGLTQAPALPDFNADGAEWWRPDACVDRRAFVGKTSMWEDVLIVKCADTSTYYASANTIY